MEHLLLKAAVTAATDQGTFDAVISTATIDREKDIVEPMAIVNAMRKWVELSKLMPLAWAHSLEPQDLIGHIDPASVKAVEREVVASGKIDMDLERGKEAWRLVKSGTLGFSFGYMIPDGGATKRVGGGLHIKVLDVFEVSATPVPANGDTRVLGWKALTEDGVTEEHVQSALNGDTENLPQDVKDRLAAMAQQMLDNTKSVDGTDKEPCVRSVDPLRKQARDLAREVMCGGVDVQQPPAMANEEPEPPEMDPAELRKHSRALMVQVLSGQEEVT